MSVLTAQSELYLVGDETQFSFTGLIIFDFKIRVGVMVSCTDFLVAGLDHPFKDPQHINIPKYKM